MNPFSALGSAVLRGLQAVGQHHDASSVAGYLQRPTEPAPDAEPLVEVDHVSAVVTRCINAISESCSNLAPLKLYDVGSNIDGRRMPKEVIDHPAITLWRHINPVQTACVYIQQIYADLLVEGNHFAALDIQNGLPVNMIRMPPHQVSVNPHPRKIIGSYTWKTPDGKSRTYKTNQVAHLATRNPDSIYRGMGLLPRLRSQIIMDRSLRNFKLNQIKNGVPAQLLFTVKRGFGEEEDIERFYDEMWQRSRGVVNAGKPFFIREGEMSVDVIPRPTEDEVAWLAAMKFTKQEIAMLFGVPPSRLSDYTESFRASATEQSRFFLQDTVMGWHRLFEDYLNTQFLPAWFPRDARRMMFKHDYNGVPALALAMRDMATVQEIAIRNGMRTPNQGAIALGDAAHENEAADELYMNGHKLGEKAPEATPPGINTEPGSTDPPRDDGDGVPPDEEQEEADRMWSEIGDELGQALYTRGGMKVNLDDLWLASATFQKQDDGDDGDLVIFGVASSDRVDRQNTIVNQKSLAGALKPYLKTGGVYYNHNWAIPAGIPLEADVRDGQTLLASKIGRDYDLMLRDPHALVETSVRYPVNDLRTAIRQGIIRNYSIAFNAEPVKKDDDDDGPVELMVTDLFEISIVSIPANVDASFSVQRASDNPIFKKMFLAEAAKQRGGRTKVTSAEAVAAAIKEGPLRFALEDDGTDWDQISKELDKCLVTPQPTTS